jgi:REP element-mobilizing transposase RayT
VGEVKERLEKIIRQVSDELGIKILDLAINPDHVHLFISAYPTISVHKIANNKLPNSISNRFTSAVIDAPLNQSINHLYQISCQPNLQGLHS